MRTRYEHPVKPGIPLEILIGTEDAESSLDTLSSASRVLCQRQPFRLDKPWVPYGVSCADKITFLVNYLDSFFQALRAFKSTAANTH